MSLVAGLAVGFGIMILGSIGMIFFAVYLRNRDAREEERQERLNRG